MLISFSSLLCYGHHFSDFEYFLLLIFCYETMCHLTIYIYRIKTCVSNNKPFNKHHINSQTMYQLICQLTNQVSNHVQTNNLFIKQFIGYTNHISISDKFVTSFQPFINYLVSNNVSSNQIR